MELTDIKLHSVKYYIGSMKLTAGDKEFDVPRTMVSNIQIKNDYKNFIYPFFYIAMNIPGWMYVAVAKNSENCYISLDLQAALFRTDLEEDKNPTMLPEYKGRYRAFCNIDTPVTDENIQMQIEKEDKTNSLITLANSYATLARVIDEYETNTMTKQVSYTKANIINAYAILETNRWEDCANFLQEAENRFNQVVNDVSIGVNQQAEINKVYVLLKEMQESVKLQDISLFYINYKNGMQTLDSIG